MESSVETVDMNLIDRGCHQSENQKGLAFGLVSLWFSMTSSSFGSCCSQHPYKVVTFCNCMGFWSLYAKLKHVNVWLGLKWCPISFWPDAAKQHNGVCCNQVITYLLLQRCKIQLINIQILCFTCISSFSRSPNPSYFLFWISRDLPSLTMLVTFHLRKHTLE